MSADNFSADDSELPVRRLCVEAFCKVTSICPELVVNTESFTSMLCSARFYIDFTARLPL